MAPRDTSFRSDRLMRSLWFYDLHELFHYSSIDHFEKIKFGFIDEFHFQTFAEYWNSYLATLAKLLVVT